MHVTYVVCLSLVVPVAAAAASSVLDLSWADLHLTMLPLRADLLTDLQRRCYLAIHRRNWAVVGVLRRQTFGDGPSSEA